MFGDHYSDPLFDHLSIPNECFCYLLHVIRNISRLIVTVIVDEAIDYWTSGFWFDFICMLCVI